MWLKQTKTRRREVSTSSNLHMRLKQTQKRRRKVSTAFIPFLFLIVVTWIGGDHVIEVNFRDSYSNQIIMTATSLTAQAARDETNNDTGRISNSSSSSSKRFRSSNEKRRLNLVEHHSLDYESCKNDSLVPENWCMDMNQIPQYVGYVGKEEEEEEDWPRPPRTIQHYTHEGYEHCLANKTVVFIGDSRVRYQFMHLASYLDTKKRMKCQDYDNGQGEDDDECFLIDEKKLNSNWTAWYKKSSSVLSNSSSVQANLCDCFRPNISRQGYERSIFENRFLRRSSPFGDINLIYLQTYHDFIRMNADFPPFTSLMSARQRCKPGECGGARSDSFEGDVNETLWKILPRLDATHVFVNDGWPARDISCELQNFERHHPKIKAVMVSHPPEVSQIGNPLSQFDPKSMKCDSDLLDRTTMNKNVPLSWYWDDVHVLSILNEAYNHLTIEKICPLAESLPLKVNRHQ